MKKPNFLVFMADHLRADMISPYNKAKMPNVEELQKDSVTFSQAFCASPHCCPSRASFFTGLYPTEHGVWNNVNVGNTLSQGLYEGLPLFTDYLKEAGYNLYYSGKWHVSALETPGDRGFVEGFTKSAVREKRSFDGPNLTDWEKYENVQFSSAEAARRDGEIQREGYPTYFLYGTKENPFKDENTVDSAIEIIKNRDKDELFFQFVGVSSPHDSYTPPERFLDLYDIDTITLPPSFYDTMDDKPNLYKKTKAPYSQLSEREHKEAIRHFLAFCSYVDYSFGRVLDALKESGQYENTVILFTSDHADYVADHGLYAKGLPCFSSAYHIPAVFHYAKGFGAQGRTYDDFVSITDFAETFTELAGCPHVFSGSSLVAFLNGNPPSEWRDTLYTQSNGNELYGIQRSVMTKKWKYVYNGFDYDELYNLEDDPDQMVNLINDETLKPVVKEMCKKMWQFAKEHTDTCVNPYVMVAHAPYGPGIIMSR